MLLMVCRPLSWCGQTATDICLLLLLLAADKRQLYEFVVRHFLASCSKDAVAFETTVTIDIAGEAFRTTGAAGTAAGNMHIGACFCSQPICSTSSYHSPAWFSL
jgi:DNA topoisomerase IA